MVASLPHIFLMLSPDFVCAARRDRDEVTLAVHTPSGHSLLFLTQMVATYDASYSKGIVHRELF